MNNDKARECSLTLLSSAYLVGEIFVKWAKVQISCCKINSGLTKIGLMCANHKGSSQAEINYKRGSWKIWELYINDPIIAEQRSKL